MSSGLTVRGRIEKGRRSGAPVRLDSGAHVPTFAAAVLLLAAGFLAPLDQAAAQESGWTIRLQPVYVLSRGHDQHVLTIHRVDLGAQTDRGEGVTLETESGTGYRAEIQYTRRGWTWGADLFWFITSQKVPRQTGAAGGAFDEVVFEVADRRFTSTGPGEVLFQQILGDTDLATWTLDLYMQRRLIESSGRRLGLQLGVRLGDFDNDFRAVAGIQDTGGSRIDASSNYGRMTGPLVGLTGSFGVGPTRVSGGLGQSVLFGEAELTGIWRDFTGPFGDSPTFVSEERIHALQDVAIPITELRVDWSYPVTGLVSLGAGAHASVWHDIPVPPGVIPMEGGDTTLHENTIFFFGFLAGVEITF